MPPEENARTVVREPIDIAALSRTGPEDGALCVFTGVVRNHNDGKSVLYLEYEGYEEMVEAIFAEIAAEARTRFGVSRVKIVHRLGRMEIGEASVAVAVSSPHRGEAFEACRFAIDTLKHKAPIWKKEFYEDGSSWLEGPGGCAHP
ncbi:MAG: molybdenum cofactor biosynthesis protein MoaE [Vicinamibacteria bacterium]|jgi:molybdopterin synthase catalytic subunit|nr:molybdenum cofactor biosynthesis protein MoaE [Vicinamibacteria bacterium]MBP9946950.1 molybdenum cofactor biosynthesis protein MoaE [Vicinamibacteria bacterium]